MTVTAPHRVAVLAFGGMSPFHLAVPSAVFASGGGTAPETGYEVVVCAEQPGRIATSAGYDVVVDHGLEQLTDADTVVLPSWDPARDPSPALVAAVRCAHVRGARVVGLCLGAYLVAASGIADGRTVATHWHAAPDLARRFPAVTVRSDILWSDLGDVVTSAGVAAALDTCLHVVRTDHGVALADAVARALVLAPHRDGTQTQFIPAPVSRHPGEDPVDRAIDWALDRLDEPIDLDTWSRQVHVARRTFTRRFRDRTGVSPGLWLVQQRLARARALLETTELTVDEVARRAGFGSAATLRLHFTEHLRTTPRRHREAFRRTEPTTVP
ncbi:GlxA family transcriptional regulator [Cellulomonas palmilytica]|uniref:GlxA family transcriptional regulator n=1 Tax=Cellulomonas palmilytica TaxID=2608402 RepID=UPI001F1B8341|nr:helix-turn-helix domain-containing protein [Cellulomonas palmilytica]UJP38714.1 helix-turn-helix domain-containing protein [Cellulomonas palmilytica]